MHRRLHHHSREPRLFQSMRTRTLQTLRRRVKKPKTKLVERRKQIFSSLPCSSLAKSKIMMRHRLCSARRRIALRRRHQRPSRLSSLPRLLTSLNRKVVHLQVLRQRRSRNFHRCRLNLRNKLSNRSRLMRISKRSQRKQNRRNCLSQTSIASQNRPSYQRQNQRQN